MNRCMRHGPNLLLALASTGCLGLLGDTQPPPPQPEVPPLPIIVKGSVPHALSNHEYRNTLSALLGYQVPASLFSGWTATATFSGFDGILWSGFSGKAAQDRVAVVEALLDGVVASSRVMICEPVGDGAECAQRILGRLATRAFRRPVTDAEVAQLVTLYRGAYALAATDAPSTQDQFCEGVRVAIAAVLLSPHLLVRLEPEPATGTRDLDAYELATRLAYFMTAEPPDDELWAVAESAAILDVEILRSQAMRLLFTRTQAFIDAFLGQLYDFRALDNAEADGLEGAFYRESSLVFRELIERDLPASSIIDPGFTYLNPALIAHYGIGPPPYTLSSDAFVRFETHERGGILQQGSVLTLTSTPTKTSPTRRGRWVQGRILCKTISPPSPDLLEQIAEVSEAIPENATVKQRVDAHRQAGDACKGCHQYMDPIGLGLESFDQHGKKRGFYDAAATLPVETNSELLGEPFETVDELNALLAGMPDVNDCIAEKMVIYGLGQMLADADQGLVAALSAKVDDHDPSFADLVQRFVTSTPFRQVAGGSP